MNPHLEDVDMQYSNLQMENSVRFKAKGVRPIDCKERVWFGYERVLGREIVGRESKESGAEKSKIVLCGKIRVKVNKSLTWRAASNWFGLFTFSQTSNRSHSYLWPGKFWHRFVT